MTYQCCCQKRKKTIKDVSDISYYVEQLKGIDVEKSILKRYVIENFVKKNIEPTEIVNPQTNPEELEYQNEASNEPKDEEFNKYVNDILKLSNIDLSDEELQTVLESYSIDTLIKAQKYNTNTKKAYEKLVDKKILFDRRKGRKTKEYGSLIKNIKLYEPLYILVKRMNSIIQNILKKRQITDKSTETIKNSFDIEKLKDLIKKYPELKENISSVLLSEFIKKDTVSKKKY